MIAELVFALAILLLAVPVLRWRFGVAPKEAEAVFEKLRGPGMPRFVANLPAAGLPLCAAGVMLLAGSIAAGKAATVGLLGVLLFGATAVWFAYRPPELAKPHGSATWSEAEGHLQVP